MVGKFLGRINIRSIGVRRGGCLQPQKKALTSKTINKTNWLVAKTNQARNRMPPIAKKTDCGSEPAMTIKKTKNWLVAKTNQARNLIYPTIGCHQPQKKTDCGSVPAMTIKIEFVWSHPLRHTNQARKHF